MRIACFFWGKVPQVASYVRNNPHKKFVIAPLQEIHPEDYSISPYISKNWKLSHRGEVMVSDNIVNDYRMERYMNEIEELNDSIDNQMICVKLSNFSYHSEVAIPFFKSILDNTTNLWNFDAEESITKQKYHYITNTLIKHNPLHTSKTYQSYLIGEQLKMMDDFYNLPKGYHFKLVRGAYLKYERKQDNKNIWQDKEMTDQQYRKMMKFAFQKYQDNNKKSFMIATHNNQDVKTAIQQFKSTSSSNFQLAHLMGFITSHRKNATSLAKIDDYEYLAYGSLRQALPYTFRRVLEMKDLIYTSIIS